jgi:hypothetical protein
MHQYLFYLSLLAALLGWIALIAVPDSKITARLVESKLLHGLICIFYTIAVFTAKGVPDNAGFFDVAGVLNLFTSTDAVIAAWLHIIVFDFFVGTWILEDSTARGVKRIIVMPILLLTIMFGPFGFLVYLCARARKKTLKPG